MRTYNDVKLDNKHIDALLSATYQLAIGVKQNPEWAAKATTDEIADWVTDQLRQLGFEITEPIGSTHGQMLGHKNW